MISALLAPFSTLTNRVTSLPPCMKPSITSEYSSPLISTVSGDRRVGRSTRSSGAGPTFGVSLWWKVKLKSLDSTPPSKVTCTGRRSAADAGATW